MIQTFDEALRPIHGAEHALCVHRETCGDVAVLERDGSFYACDHFVDAAHRVGNCAGGASPTSPPIRSCGPSARRSGAPCPECAANASSCRSATEAAPRTVPDDVRRREGLKLSLPRLPRLFRPRGRRARAPFGAHEGGPAPAGLQARCRGAPQSKLILVPGDGA